MPVRRIRRIANRMFNAEERRLVAQTASIGLLVWAVVFALKTLVHGVFEAVVELVGKSPTEALILVPLLLGAAGVAAIVRWWSGVVRYRDSGGRAHELSDVEGDGLERAIALYFTSEPTLEQALQGKEGVEARWELPTFSLALRKFVATLLTLGSGGSGGLEASVTLIGESLAAGLMKPRGTGTAMRQRIGVLERFRNWWLPTAPDSLQTAQLAGIAAAVATLLGTPLAAAFFATEVMYRRRPIIEKLLYSLIGSLVAFFMTSLVTGHPTMFGIKVLAKPPGTVRYYLALVLVAVVIAAVGRVFIFTRGRTESWLQARFPNLWTRHLVGALATGLIALAAVAVTGQELSLILGTGDHPIELALQGRLTMMVAAVALLAKLLATLATVGSGGSAGLLVPSLYFGTMVAAALAPLTGFAPPMLIIPAMTASLVSLVNIPLAAILFTVEAFGAPYMIPSLVVLVVTFLLAQDHSIYRTQRETYEYRQILPGYSVRRVPVPASWQGRTLVDLQVRRRFGLNVIGLLQARASGSQFDYQMTFDPARTDPLQRGDTLIVLGKDELLVDFERAINLQGGQAGGGLALEEI